MDRRAFLTASCACATASTAALAQVTSMSATARRPWKVEAVRPKVAQAVQLFPLEQIALLDGPVARQREMNRQYLLKLEPDRLLSAFRLNAGLDPKAAVYRGWESEKPALWGHILAFYLSGSGYMVQATGDQELARRLDYITDELHAVQEAHASGYLLAVPKGRKLFAEIAAGKFEITNASATYGYEINNVFEPTYTWNKITLGLFQAYKATGNPRTRAVLVRTADWFGHDVLDHLSDAQIQTLLFCEHGSIHESMLQVHQLTGDPKYLRWARALCFKRILDPLAAGDTNFITGYHANCSIPVFTGAARIYQQTGDEHLRKAAVTFLDEVIDRRSWVNGGNSAGEHFFAPQGFEKALQSPAGPESCNSVNMLRLIEAVYATDPDPKYLDHYERLLWNHLLASHEPERHMVNYYIGMRPGTYRVYSDEFDSMWCCVGTGLECPGKYGQMIYSRGGAGDSVDVNLFIASRLDWSEAGVVVQQETAFPDQPRTSLTMIDAPAGVFTVRVRHPWWIPAGGMRLSLNGTSIPSNSGPGRHAVVTRTWRKGDRLDVELPMTVSVAKLPASENYAAILYGPIVLAGRLGREGLTKQTFWGLATPVPEVILPEEKFPAIKVPLDQVADCLTPVPGQPLTFKLAGATTLANTVTLVPLFRNHFERYAVYWKRA